MDDVIEYEQEWPTQQSAAHIQAASWWLAERVIKGCDVVRMDWTDTPAGVGYDTLHLEIQHQGTDCGVWINRGGSVHVHTRSRSVRFEYPGVWQMLLTPTGRERVRSDVFRQLDIKPRHGTASTPRSVMCRVISQAMYQAVPMAGEWRTWAEFAHEADQVHEDGEAEVPHDMDAERERREASLTWVIGCNWEPMARFKDGWMWLRSGERMDLYGGYRSDRTIVQMAALVHAQAERAREVATGVSEFGATT